MKARPLAVLVSLSLATLAVAVNVICLREAFGAGPPHYGRTANT
jgi:hypothetical protein